MGYYAQTWTVWDLDSYKLNRHLKTCTWKHPAPAAEHPTSENRCSLAAVRGAFPSAHLHLETWTWANKAFTHGYHIKTSWLNSSMGNGRCCGTSLTMPQVSAEHQKRAWASQDLLAMHIMAASHFFKLRFKHFQKHHTRPKKGKSQRDMTKAMSRPSLNPAAEKGISKTIWRRVKN